ncbi:MAG: zinc permease [Acidobacteriota bacterium]|nr:zinc permease [Acidobacteriota bacterium]
MSFFETTLLGAIAGFTIYLGLPIGRLEATSVRLRVGLAMFSAGILAFIFVDVMTHAREIVDAALQNFKDSRAGFWPVLGLFAILAVAFTLGTAGISHAERTIRRRRTAVVPVRGGAATATLATDELRLQQERNRAALKTGLIIAAAIGVHNFAEGLAIGVSAKAGAIGLATVLIIGFGLHNATEGFGIIGPLGGVRPSWRWLGLAGLIGGGPTFVGTLVGYQLHSDALELCAYALAGGAILYVIGEIWGGMRRFGHRTSGLYLLAAGFLVGVATDLIVSYGGG